MERKIIKRKRFVVIYRSILVLISLYSLISTFCLTDSIQLLNYFTMQTNIMIAILFIILLIGSIKNLNNNDKEIYNIKEWIQLGIIFFIQITFLVYAFMLSGTFFTMGVFSISNVLLHYVVPIMALIDWILFLPHGKIKSKNILLWLSYPAIYVIYSFIRAEIGKPFSNGSRYPYFFMDMDIQGWNLVWICILFFIGFFLLGYLIVFIDRKLISKKKEEHND